MKKRLLIYWGLMICSAIVTAQSLEDIFVKADFFATRQYDSCLVYARKGWQMANRQHQVEYQGAFECILGKQKYFLGDYDSAAIYLHNAVTLLKPLAPNIKLAFAYNELGKLYRKTNKYNAALSVYNNALHIYEQLQDKKGVMMIHNERGVVFELQQQYTDAIRDYQQSFQLADRLHDTTGMAYALNFIGNIRVLQKNYMVADSLFARCVNYHQLVHDSFAVAWSKLDVAQCLYQQNKFVLASAALSDVKYLAQKINIPDLLSKAYLIEARIDSVQGNFKAAHQSIVRYYQTKDSLFSIENQRVIEELNTRYETAQHQQVIQSQKNAIHFRNIILLASLIIVLLSSGLVVARFKQNKIKQQQQLQAIVLQQQDLATKAVIEAEEKERQRIAADLHDGVGQLLSATKMNLHALEDHTISHNENILQRAIALVDESAKEIRSTSHNIMPNALIKSGLGFAVKDFIEKIDQHSLQVNVYTHGMQQKLHPNVEIVVYRVIQECVNNVIKHAQATRLDISLIHESNELNITIEDNGKGFDIAKAKDQSGIGLKNIETRIAYLKGNIEIDSKLGNGTSFAIHIPLQDISYATN